jgi:hypothetical protein
MLSGKRTARAKRACCDPQRHGGGSRSLDWP